MRISFESKSLIVAQISDGTSSIKSKSPFVIRSDSSVEKLMIREIMERSDASE
jgi:hypothetical protein